MTLKVGDHVRPKTMRPLYRRNESGALEQLYVFDKDTLGQVVEVEGAQGDDTIIAVLILDSFDCVRTFASRWARVETNSGEEQ
jgi:hypothetical protein